MNTDGPRPNTIGLSASEVAQQLSRDGPNAQPQPDRRQWPRLLASVLREPMLLLIAASVLYLSVGEARDAAALGLSVLLVVGLTQEVRGQALAEVSATGSRTEMGRIGATLGTDDDAGRSLHVYSGSWPGSIHNSAFQSML